MTAAPDFDVAVVGAGPAGSVTALRLAGQGHSVVLVERGEAPGAKNLSGGVLYGRVLDQVLPGFAEQAPVQRHIVRNVLTFLTDTGAVAVDSTSTRLAGNAVTVLRSSFDAWLAEQAEAAGAFLMPGVRVDRPLVESGRVVGVVAGDDELRARVVVAADGVNSFLARSIGLRKQPPTHHLAVGVKAVVGMDRGRLEERFALEGDQGVAYAMVGEATRGVGGGGFLYTNAASISVGVVLRLDDLVARGERASGLFDHFCAHPEVARFLRGGELLEYGSHLVAEGGLTMLGEVASDGLVVVGDAAGLTINSGLTVRGMDLAIGSAVAASDAIHEALEAEDTSAVGLAGYRSRLMSGFVGRDLTTYAKAPAFLERPRMYQEYGRVLETIMTDAFDLDTTPRRHLAAVARDALKASPVRWRDLASDGLAGVRAL